MLLNINVYLTIPVDITGRVLFDEKFAFTTVHTVEHVEFGPEMGKLVVITKILYNSLRLTVRTTI